MWATTRGHGENLRSLRAYYLGYSVTYLGAFIGLGWAVVHGFVAGVLIAWFYDLFSKILYGPKGSA